MHDVTRCNVRVNTLLFVREFVTKLRAVASFYCKVWVLQGSCLDIQQDKGCSLAVPCLSAFRKCKTQNAAKLKKRIGQGAARRPVGSQTSHHPGMGANQATRCATFSGAKKEIRETASWWSSENVKKGFLIWVDPINLRLIPFSFG